MKQVFLRGAEVTVEEMPAPGIRDNEILVEVAYSVISTGTETAAIVSRSWSNLVFRATKGSLLEKAAQSVRQRGLVSTARTLKDRLNALNELGYSCAGRVRQKGRNVTEFSRGDWVACAGTSVATHAEVVVAPPNLTARVPDGCDLKDAASVAMGAVAVQALRRSDAKLGESVAVVGLGLVGLILVQVLKANGCRVIGSDLDSARLRLGSQLGLDAGFLDSDPDYRERLMLFTDGRGADATLITASAPDTNALLHKAIEMTRERGRVVVVGDIGLSIDRRQWYEKDVELLICRSYGPGRYDPQYEVEGKDYPFAHVRWTEKRNMLAYLDLLAKKQVTFSSLIGAVYPVEQAREAYQRLREPDRPIAIVLTYGRAEPGTAETKFARQLATGIQRRRQGTLKTALIGAGGFAAAVHLPNLQRLSDLYEVHTLVGRRGKTIRELADIHKIAHLSTDYASVLSDPSIDAVMICTRHHLHAKMAVDAARAGKPTFLEKPMALNREELSAMMSVIAESKVPFLVGFNRRFSPPARRLRSALQGRKGPLIAVYRVNSEPLPRDHWVNGPEGGGRIIGESCHMFDLFNFLVGLKPEKVTARAVGGTNRLAAGNVTATVSYSDGSMCTLVYLSIGNQSLPKERLEIFWDSRSAILDNFQQLTFYGVAERNWQSRNPQKGHLEELQAFAEAVLGRGRNLPSLEEMASATLLSFEAHDQVCDSQPRHQ